VIGSAADYATPPSDWVVRLLTAQGPQDHTDLDTRVAEHALLETLGEQGAATPTWTRENFEMLSSLPAARSEYPFGARPRGPDL
jgi:hypothetical protein